MRELALHLLDLAQNSIVANAQTITLTVIENRAADRLRLQVEDDGCGMTAEMAAKVVDPFVTSRTTRKVGLGIPLLKAAAEACCGGLTIQTAPGQGTTVTVEFQLSHIDRMPLGDLAGTLLTLVVCAPEIHWIFRYQVDGREFYYDDAPVKEAVAGLPLTDPLVLSSIRQLIENGIAGVQSTQEPLPRLEPAGTPAP